MAYSSCAVAMMPDCQNQNLRRYDSLMGRRKKPSTSRSLGVARSLFVEPSISKRRSNKGEQLVQKFEKNFAEMDLKNKRNNEK